MTRALLRQHALVVCAVLHLVSASTLGAQGRSLTVLELKSIYASADETFGWGEHQVPEFVAAAYGRRARAALLAILSEPSSRENYLFQRSALSTAEYGRVGVPREILIDYASGRGGSHLGGTLQQRALFALSMQADPTLTPFWLRLFREEQNTSFRQVAPAGLACASGLVALADLAIMRRDADPQVARVAEFYYRELTVNGDTARVCGGRVTRDQVSSFPLELHPDLREKGASILRRIP